jgi:hypothetical protein
MIAQKLGEECDTKRNRHYTTLTVCDAMRERELRRIKNDKSKIDATLQKELWINFESFG